ncbi:hypothetical protein EYF80_012732 [Liparis tanakae]|uniref:Uncharacterized protein n=1 Tax=Liparis tanakae TaxID=230148 RepID=A0A4Z2II17_9TELE|nr:hypothetical protein EYF80_012732 [Liparis tanakae]
MIRDREKLETRNPRETRKLIAAMEIIADLADLGVISLPFIHLPEPCGGPRFITPEELKPAAFNNSDRKQIGGRQTCYLSAPAECQLTEGKGKLRQLCSFSVDLMSPSLLFGLHRPTTESSPPWKLSGRRSARSGCEPRPAAARCSLLTRRRPPSCLHIFRHTRKLPRYIAMLMKMKAVPAICPPSTRHRLAMMGLTPMVV